MGGAIGFGVAQFGIIHYAWFAPNPEQVKQRENEIYKKGATKGMLIVMNYERKSEGEEPFKDWAAVEAYGDSLKGMEKFFQEIDEERAKKKKAKEDYPDKPWVKK